MLAHIILNQENTHLYAGNFALPSPYLGPTLLCILNGRWWKFKRRVQ